MNFDNIPDSLRHLPQWVLWHLVSRDGVETKIPCSISGQPARANDPRTWHAYNDVVAAYNPDRDAGLGFMFAETDPFCGIDLDGCRDPATGQIDSWAVQIITDLESYAEVSPSGTGVKIWIMGRLPDGVRHKYEIPDTPAIHGKQPAIEAYDTRRYFAVTGDRPNGVPNEPQPRQEQLDALIARYLSRPTGPPVATGELPTITPLVNAQVINRARSYLATVEPAVSGQSGHNVTFRAACSLVLGFALDRETALALLAEWNQRCEPPWSNHELEHKIDSALQQDGPRGHLLATSPTTTVMANQVSPGQARPSITTLAAAAQRHIEMIRNGPEQLTETGLPDLDHAIGGGMQQGEMVILAARPSHGKSMVGLQHVHTWTATGKKTLIISEEMTSQALGKRTLQFASGIPVANWAATIDELEHELAIYVQSHADCWIAEACRTIEVVVDTVEQAVVEHQVECVVVDYAQLLTGPGRTRYDQVSNISIHLRQLATKHNLLMFVLCQMSRDIESRSRFAPRSSDLRESGQLEQDADVVMFCVWPHRLDTTRNPHDFQFFITKNRNRPINQGAVQCRIEPERQRVLAAPPLVRPSMPHRISIHPIAPTQPSLA